MTSTNYKRNEKRKYKNGYNAPFVFGKVTLLPDGNVDINGTIHYSEREHEGFRGDLKSFEKRLREKGL